MPNVTTRSTPRYLANLEPFKTGGAFSAVLGTPYSTGRLQGEHYDQYKTDRDHIVYTVMSYATPIAWVVKRDGETRTVIPNVTYSRTTSTHQNLCRNHMPSQSK